MPRNVEIKARVHDMIVLLKTARYLNNDKDGIVLKQSDIFYNCNQGRLKLRSIEESGKSRSELIAYERPDVEGPKISDFSRTAVLNFAEMDNTLTTSLGQKGAVKKQRTLFILGQTRVHVDKVENLGNFMELEVMLRDDQTLDDGDKIARDLMQKLGVSDNDLITGAYFDLLGKKV